jgi:hypothetical protein
MDSISQDAGVAWDASILSPEGIPVTMQVGMVASDGIILASHTQATHTPEKLLDGQIGRAVRYHTNFSKIRTGSEIMLSYAQDVKTGDDVANVIPVTQREGHEQ